MAAATAWGTSALALVRLSGAGVEAVLAGVVRPLRPGPLGATPRRVELLDADGVFDDGVALLRRAPGTATGEDLCEITVHGNPLIVERLVAACVSGGARPARPGEFTRRAVLNGRLDLTRAEAVDQVIRATSPGGLRLARAGLDGRLSSEIHRLRLALVTAAAELEARLDLPGDALAHESDAEVIARLVEVSGSAAALAGTERAGRALVDGARVALVGPVNAGKSSLFNALLGRTRALVHHRPGTTRDAVEARAFIGPVQVTLLDTAGERRATDPVEVAGQALARGLVDEADVVVVVLAAKPGGLTATEQLLLTATADRARVVVYNGVDRGGVAPGPDGAVPTSAVSGAGLDALRRAVVAAVGVGAAGGEVLLASARQRDLLLAVAAAADEAVQALPGAGVAVAADAVTRGVERIDELTGADTREDVLDAVFARFCIGK